MHESGFEGLFSKENDITEEITYGKQHQRRAASALCNGQRPSLRVRFATLSCWDDSLMQVRTQ